MRGTLLAVGAVLGLALACSDNGDTSEAGGTTGTTGSGSSETSTSSTSGSEGSTGEPTGTTGVVCQTEEPTVIFPRTSISADELAVLVNDSDPLSVEIAAYYVEQRQIPEANVIHLDFVPVDTMPPDDFAPLKTEVDQMLSDDIQAIAITWIEPYRVGCMGVTSAFAFGYGDQWCHTGGGCAETAMSDLYDSSTLAPYTDHGIRPAMMLAATNAEDAYALIDRGVAADLSFPLEMGYMMRTTDNARSVRYFDFLATIDYWDHDMQPLELTYIDNNDGAGLNYLENTNDVLFYFTGLANVPEIDTNTYLPGAIADHLTSFGGQVPDAGMQMSCLRWLEAGATASYGTVREPCNFPAKFPNTLIVLPNYFRGQTLIEAYWKSVAWPGEGLFVGEPLARPWAESFVEFGDCQLTISTTLLEPHVDYDIQGAWEEDGPWETVQTGNVPYAVFLDIVINPVEFPYYRIVRVG